MCLRAEEGQFFFSFFFGDGLPQHFGLVFRRVYTSIWASGGREAGNLVAAFVTDRYPFTERWLLFVSHLYLDFLEIFS